MDAGLIGAQGWSAVSLRACLLLVTTLLLLPSAEGVAQTNAARTTEPQISGQVVDAQSRTPLEGALVELERVGRSSAGSQSVEAVERRVATDQAGRYEFRELPRGEYRLEVSRIGYVGAVVRIDLRSAGSSRLSVGLDIDPISLSPLAVIGTRPETYGRLRDAEPGVNDISLIDQLRQRRHLVGDTRELTHREVVSAVTLAETDLFRALQRIPGVSTRDDYTATMWTRGATWDQTRVYFDGLPLYNPTHAGWLFAAVNPDAIASASFHPGYRPARWGEGSAGVLDLRSRSGRPGQPLRGSAEISMASTRIALDGSSRNNRFNWMVAARRSYVDIFSELVESVLDEENLQVPYDFTDITARADADLGGDWSVTGSGFLEYDNLRGDIPGLLEGNRGKWGNRAGRLSVEGPMGPFRASLTGGMTRFGTLIFDRQVEKVTEDVTLPTLENAILNRRLGVEIAPLNPRGRFGEWTVGAEVMSDSVSYDGPFSLIGALVHGAVVGDSVSNRPFHYGRSLVQGTIWAEKRWGLRRDLNAITGARLEGGPTVANGGQLRIAPRAAIRYEPNDIFAVTGGWSRNYQYTQDVSPAAGPIGPQLHLSAIWVLASPAPAFPAIRTDQFTVGFEAEWGTGWSSLVNLYDRRSSGLKIPNPVPGSVNVARDLDTEADGEAVGAEVALRRLTERFTGSVGYSWGRSTIKSTPIDPDEPVLEFASSADIRHGVDATAVYRVGQKLQVGGAFTFGSGVPFTRLLVGDGTRDVLPQLEAPNAERTPAYASLDVSVEYEHTFTDWSMSGYLQLRNVANRDNAVTYAGSVTCPLAETSKFPARYAESCEGRTGVVDRFEPGLPRLPLLGVRIVF